VRSTTPGGIGGSDAIGSAGFAATTLPFRPCAPHESAVGKGAVRGRDGRGREVEGHRELAHRREPTSDRNPTTGDQPLGRVRQL